MSPSCLQVNLQTGWGGGEGYTIFFTRALLAAGVATRIAVHADNPYWRKRLPAGCELLPVRSMEELAARLQSGQRQWLLFHTPAAASSVAPLRTAGHYLTSIAHMPLYGRNPETLRHYDRIFAVSGHVLASLQAAGLANGYPEPLLGIADLAGRDGGPAGGEPPALVATSPYDWDRRKGRDRLLARLYPLYATLRPGQTWTKEPSIALGIVSRLTPIKQFPELFRHLAPVIAAHPGCHLDIVGAGGYASVRDLRRALAPLGGRARFWGHQRDVGAVYRRIDYLLTGLPEKEALGLNVIEAQACGTPVLAVNAPPFTETVAHDVTGLLFDDPRKDGGAAFDALLRRLATQPFRIDAARAAPHLARFSESAFQQRVMRLVEATPTRFKS